MTKYTKKLKLRVVKTYLNNEGGYRYLANTYPIRDYPQVKKWIELYNYYSKQGLERKLSSQGVAELSKNLKKVIKN